MPIKIILIAISLLMILSACGGGSGSDSLPSKDTSAPKIQNKSPENHEIDINIFQPIKITFDENIASVTESNIILLKYQSSNPNNFDEKLQAVDRVKINVVVNNNILTITPVSGISNGFVEFTNESRYQLTIQNIKDNSNNSIVKTTWEFATTTVPSVKNFLPLPKETVSRSSNITIIFSEEIESSSFKFRLEDLGPNTSLHKTPIEVTEMNVSFNPITYTATLSLPVNSPLLNEFSQYQVTLIQAVDLKGNTISSPIIWNFNTNNIITNNKLQTQPSNVIAKAHNDRIEISWNKAPTITGISQINYNIYVKEGDLGYMLLNNTSSISNLNYTHRNIQIGTNYSYAVTAVANGLQSIKVFNSNNGVIPQELLNYTSQQPTVINGDAQVIINWPSLSGAQSYNLYVKVDNSTTYTLLNKNPISSLTSAHP